MRARKTIILAIAGLLLTALFASGASSADKNAWRIQGKLLRIGDSKGRVLALAGEPDFRETIQHAVDVGEGDTEKIEVWYYRDDSRDKLHTITFTNGRVSRIEWERY